MTTPLSEQPPVEAVVFDFGGVFTASPFTALMAVAATQALDPMTMVSVMFGPYDQDTDHPWHQLERGEITLDDASAGIVELAAAEGVVDFQPMEMLMALGGMGVRPAVPLPPPRRPSGGQVLGLRR